MCFSFQINQTSGEIQTSVSLDRETVNRHMLTVVAADNDSPESLSSQVEVLVLVEDVNDNPPVFVEKEYSLSLSLYTQPGLLLRVNVRQVLCFWVKNGLCFYFGRSNVTRIMLRFTYLIRKNPEVSLQLLEVSLFFAVILVPVRPASLRHKTPQSYSRRGPCRTQ